MLDKDLLAKIDTQLSSLSDEVDNLNYELSQSGKNINSQNIEKLTEEAREFNEKNRRPWYARWFLKD